MRKEAAAYFVKTAKKKKELDRDPGWWKSQKGMYRAMRESDKGVGKLLASDELIGRRTKGQLKGGLVGGVGGAGLGTVAGSLAGKGLRGTGYGAALGGILGAAGGQMYGMAKADYDYLKKRGITQRALGLGGARFSEKARKKYLAKHGD
jgi:hypothetical protein